MTIEQRSLSPIAPSNHELRARAEKAEAERDRLQQDCASIASENACRMISERRLRAALEGMCAEFRAYDLPYGSPAYLKASEALASHVVDEKAAGSPQRDTVETTAGPHDPPDGCLDCLKVERAAPLTCKCGKYGLSKPFGLVWETGPGSAGKCPHSMKECPSAARTCSACGGAIDPAGYGRHKAGCQNAPGKFE